MRGCTAELGQELQRFDRARRQRSWATLGEFIEPSRGLSISTSSGGGSDGEEFVTKTFQHSRQDVQRGTVAWTDMGLDELESCAGGVCTLECAALPNDEYSCRADRGDVTEYRWVKQRDRFFLLGIDHTIQY